MKFLFDLNIISFSDQNSSATKSVISDIPKLLNLLENAAFQLYIHPTSLEQVGDNEDHHAQFDQILHKCEELTAIETSEEEGDLVDADDLAHFSLDATEIALLEAVLKNEVNFLITENNEIHRLSQHLGMESRVLTLPDALATVRGFSPQPLRTLPHIQLVHADQLKKDDEIFDSLREDYSEFDSWLEKIQEEKRQVYLVQEDNKHAAIAILKREENNDIGIEGTVLKICTFKVGNVGSGYRYGELLLRSVFDYANSHGIPKTYLTCYPKQEPLMRFLRRFGFDEHSKQENGEIAFVKSFVPLSSDLQGLTPLESHIKFGPYCLISQGVGTYAVPIQPIYHQLLFPNLEEQLSLLSESRPCGNSILKAYLCHSKIRILVPGSLLLFYRSGGLKRVEAIGVVDQCIRSSSAEEIAQFVGKRTVYSIEDIEDMSKKETLVILFRYAIEVPPVSLAEMLDNRALSSHPQSITPIKPEAAQWIKELIEQ